MSRAMLSNLIGSLYESAVDSEATADFLTVLKSALGANNTTLGLFDAVSGTERYLMRDVPEEVATAYLARIADDPRVNAAIALTPGALVVRDEDVVDLSAFQKTEYFHEVIKPYDYDQFITLGCFGYGGCDFYAIGNRSRRDNSFGEEDKKLLWALVPHMERSLRIHFRVKQRPYSPSRPTLQVDKNGFVIEMDSSAIDLERSGDCFRVVDGCLRLPNPAHDKLGQLVQDACGLGQPIRVPMVPSVRVIGNLGTYQLLVYPAIDNPSDLYRERSVTISVLSIDSAREVTRHESWELSIAEQEVLALFLSGYDLQAIAGRRNRSVHTVRTQLKSILRKSGARSQVELVRMLQGDAPGEAELPTDPHAEQRRTPH